MIIKDTSNITVTEALKMGLKLGGGFNHYIVNRQNGKIEKIRYGRVIGIYRFFLWLRLRVKKDMNAENVCLITY